MRALTKEEQEELLRQQEELRKKRSKKSVAEAEQKVGITDAADVALVVPWSELHRGRFAELFKGLQVRRCESALDFWSNQVRALHANYLPPGCTGHDRTNHVHCI
jgi:hypothetical protein